MIAYCTTPQLEQSFDLGSLTIHNQM